MAAAHPPRHPVHDTSVKGALSSSTSPAYSLPTPTPSPSRHPPLPGPVVLPFPFLLPDRPTDPPHFLPQNYVLVKRFVLCLSF